LETEPLVIFDCYGVLVDSEPIAMAVWLEIIAEAGGDVEEHLSYRRFLGRSLAHDLRVLEEEFHLSIAPGALSTMQTRLYRRLRRELQPISGVSEAIRRLDGRCCVASSSQLDRIRLSLSVTGLLDQFEPNLFSGSEVSNGKPAPDLFLHAASSMGTNPSNCVVIEDSPAGILAAQRAGMTVFAFIGGSHAGPSGLFDAVMPLKPDIVFDHMRALPNLIASARDRKALDRHASA
jgi:HAD superfamily hydrolase (TIGR01509 family)